MIPCLQFVLCLLFFPSQQTDGSLLLLPRMTCRRFTLSVFSIPPFFYMLAPDTVFQFHYSRSHKSLSAVCFFWGGAISPLFIYPMKRVLAALYSSDWGPQRGKAHLSRHSSNCPSIFVLPWYVLLAHSPHFVTSRGRRISSECISFLFPCRPPN